MAETPHHFAHADYTVGWICALPETELVAAAAMLDEEHRLLPAADPQDANSYLLGKIGDHNVVIACLPAETTGKVLAATVAKDMLRSFPAVRFGLMVGVGGGAPYYGPQVNPDQECGDEAVNIEDDSEDEAEDVRDIRLGDVVVSLHTKSTEAVVQYDFGKSWQEKEFVHTGGKLNKPPPKVLSAVSILQQQHKRRGNEILGLLQAMVSENPAMAKEFQYPGLKRDRLFKSDIVHVEGKRSCKACCGPNNANLVKRPGRPTVAPEIHYGSIGSADQVMKDAVLRDKWAEKENIICFEMEAAGLMDSFPCLVIRGICDYADSHKTKIWQPYAAATAAAYAKELLHVIPGQDVIRLRMLEHLFDKVDAVEKDTAATRQVVISSQEDQTRAKVISWVSKLDYAAKQNDTIARRKPGTGVWLLSRSIFTTWIEAASQTLFCPGIPGAGKTIIASVVIEHLQLSFLKENIGIAYIFCAHNERHKAKSLVACLIKQLVTQLPYLPQEVRELYDLHEKHNTYPQNADLIQVFVHIVSGFSKVFIVIDAIDECQDENDRNIFLLIIQNIKEHAHLFVTSRPIASIEEYFKNDLHEEIKATDEDIMAYVKSEISSESFILSTEISSRPELEMHIVEKIVSKAKGMFLHAQFHVKYLATKHNIRNLEEALADLPRTSDAIYDTTMTRVQKQNVEAAMLAQNTLQWLVCACRPVTIREIQHALAIRDDDTAIPNEALTAPKYLISICGGLVAIDQESDIIRLVHYTAQEYFKVKNFDYFPNAEANVTSICLRYLLLEEFGKGYCTDPQQMKARVFRYPLLDYAARNLVFHLRRVDSGSCVHDLLLLLLLDTNKLSCAVQIFFLARKSSRSTYRPWLLPKSSRKLTIGVPKNFHCLHYAAFFGLEEISRRLILGHEHETCINSYDSSGRTPLSWAAENGHEAVVKLLLKNGANTDSMYYDEKSQTPLMCAVRSGHEKIAKLLLESGSLVDCPDKRSSYSPLSWAAAKGYENVVKILLENGATVDGRGPSDNPLSRAAENGHEAVIKVLFENGAAVDSADYDNMTPLSWAAQNGHQAVVRLLLGYGVVIDSISKKDGRTPLSWATVYGSEEVVRLLIENGAAVNSLDAEGLTPLSLAINYEDGAVIELLRANGAIIEYTDSHSE